MARASTVAMTAGSPWTMNGPTVLTSTSPEPTRAWTLSAWPCRPGPRAGPRTARPAPRAGPGRVRPAPAWPGRGDCLGRQRPVYPVPRTARPRPAEPSDGMTGSAVPSPPPSPKRKPTTMVTVEPRPTGEPAAGTGGRPGRPRGSRTGACCGSPGGRPLPAAAPGPGGRSRRGPAPGLAAPGSWAPGWSAARSWSAAARCSEAGRSRSGGRSSRRPAPWWPWAGSGPTLSRAARRPAARP